MTFEVDVTLTPPLGASEAQRRLWTTPEGSSRAVLGDVVSFHRGPESAGGPPAAASAQGVVPSTGSPFGAVEGGSSLGILTPGDFALRLEVLRDFAADSSLLRSW